MGHKLGFKAVCCPACGAACLSPTTTGMPTELQCAALLHSLQAPGPYYPCPLGMRVPGVAGRSGRRQLVVPALRALARQGSSRGSRERQGSSSSSRRTSSSSSGTTVSCEIRGLLSWRSSSSSSYLSVTSGHRSHIQHQLQQQLQAAVCRCSAAAAGASAALAHQSHRARWP